MLPFNLQHRVNRFILGLIISAREHFTHQSQGKELNPANDEDHGSEKHRPVLQHYGLMKKQLLSQQEQPHEKTRPSSKESDSAKKLQRSGRIVEKKLNADQVQHDSKSP